MNKLYWIVCDDKETNVFEGRYQGRTRGEALKFLKQTIGRKTLNGLVFTITEIPVPLIREIVAEILAGGDGSNATLAANVVPLKRMEKRLANEQYRQWLVDLVRPHTVILITARPETWMMRTLDRIEAQTGWRPQDACFAPIGWWNPPAIKQHFLHKRVFPIHGEHARYIAIESNPRSREMYAKFSIPCLWVTGEGTWLTDGIRIGRSLSPRFQ